MRKNRRGQPFETVHLSLNVKDVLALASSVSPGRERVVAPASVPPAPAKIEQSRFSQNDLQIQVRELTSSNLELRARLDEQSKRMQALTD